MLDPSVAFCHNDLQENNILLSESTELSSLREIKLSMIDFEYASYNYCAFDLGNVVCETYIENRSDKPEGFQILHEHYPNEEFIAAFVKQYLQARSLLTSVEVNKVIKETYFFTLCSHLLWALWAVISAASAASAGASTHSSTKWGYVEYAQQRLVEFYTHKAKYLEKYNKEK